MVFNKFLHCSFLNIPDTVKGNMAILSVTAVQISERRQTKVKTTVSDESIKMRKFISMTMTMLKIGFIGFGGGKRTDSSN